MFGTLASTTIGLVLVLGTVGIAFVIGLVTVRCRPRLGGELMASGRTGIWCRPARPMISSASGGGPRTSWSGAQPSRCSCFGAGLHNPEYAIGQFTQEREDSRDIEARQ